MKRSQFCKKLITPGIACGCALALHPGEIFGSVAQDKPQQDPKETPCNEKMEFTQQWVKRFFDILDERIDVKTRTDLMLANGVACAKGAYGELPANDPASIEDIDKTIASWQERLGKENIYRDGNVIYLRYVGNPKGLKIADGYCLCPMVEDGPATLSPTFCQCSVGYVQYMFQRFITFKPVKVELLEALRTGGKSCHFKVLI